ncbi:MAG: NAD(P) transhydrogenase subunit alpha part 1 [Fimbriimonadales bacterium]|nr:MAG: Re/Si-specific NAD(P)(+) transhydrogenase subunit alpha [Armatimonadota bacterium]MBV6504437.1 NAD(P) transhydrogenase subunit alpha part 1 [Fimbriimonadales bacterium]MCE7900992.1 Re/Si-specific NAD(P)(+) transhydrogenase subunit alpha [Armatimonadetes bacterium ATM1]MDL1929582.1 Re/Si-specific NAD(P)(+) transhydrogenase subunit alpha [Fimbriimonadia bacterium ATM]MBC6970854.1 Re/Si-specific NAD(P)(+) transhydrogenase subunit alpha [Armatimonadota bacterium]
MTVGVPKETAPAERRVALTPEGAKALASQGFSVLIESGAGEGSLYSDREYEEAGAKICPGPGELYSQADIILKVVGPEDGHPDSDVQRLREGSGLIALMFPHANVDTAGALAKRNITSFAMDLMPRITRAQTMDAISSMSTIAGYRAALLAASALPKFFPMLMTAAGTLAPARVLVIGAGVAGLQAIATCRKLGAIVEAFDVRPAVKEQVQSLGAKFVDLGLSGEEAEDAGGYAKEVSGTTHSKELEIIASRLPKCDVVITTALIPGKHAPVLITKEMVKLMARGSVIVDLAAVNGGNCEATKPGETTQFEGVKIIAPLDLPSEMAVHASKMYSKNITELLLHLVKDGKLALDMDDEITHGTLVTHDGRIMHEPTRLKYERTKQS